MVDLCLILCPTSLSNLCIFMYDFHVSNLILMTTGDLFVKPSLSYVFNYGIVESE